MWLSCPGICPLLQYHDPNVSPFEPGCTYPYSSRCMEKMNSSVELSYRLSEDAMPLYAMLSLRQTKDIMEVAFEVST
jgi:hypothetical protein